MRDPRNRRLAVMLLVASSVVLGGCGGKPTPFPVPESEMGDRPGLFTGERGAWELYPVPAARPQSQPR